MYYGNLTGQKRKPHPHTQKQAEKSLSPMAVFSWQQALRACLKDWPARKAEWQNIWKARPTFVGQQANPVWLADIEACLKAEASRQQVSELEALLAPVAYELVLAGKADNARSSLNGQELSLDEVDFKYLYALADLQRSETETDLISAKLLYQRVLALFPELASPHADEKSQLRAFEARLEEVLAAQEINLNSASIMRWRNLLKSQAMRYISGMDDKDTFALNSELNQHRDLLDLMLMRYEKMNGMKPIETQAGRLYRFFVMDAEAIEIKHRLGAYVARHMRRVYQALAQVQQGLAGRGCPQEILWGQPDAVAWQTAIRQGYALDASVSVRLEYAVPVAESV